MNETEKKKNIFFYGFRKITAYCLNALFFNLWGTFLGMYLFLLTCKLADVTSD